MQASEKSERIERARSARLLSPTLTKTSQSAAETWEAGILLSVPFVSDTASQSEAVSKYQRESGRGAYKEGLLRGTI